MSQTIEGVIGYGNLLLADPNSGIRGNGYQIEWTLVPNSYRVGAFYVQMSAAVAAGVVSLPVDATPQAIKAGTIIDFGGALFARVSADVAAGVTAIPVDATPTAIPDNTRGLVAGNGPKMLKAGTAVGKAGSPSGKKVFPRVVTTNPAIGLLIEDVVEGNPSSGYTGHGVYEGGFFWENRLPDAIANGGTLPAAIKTELGARFVFKMAENNAPTS